MVFNRVDPAVDKRLAFSSPVIVALFQLSSKPKSLGTIFVMTLTFSVGWGRFC